tara:strand:+ start:67 stop:168 length:102 start_codon:yes stop_codon:yes gene_type:complete
MKILNPKLLDFRKEYEMIVLKWRKIISNYFENI